MALYVRGRMSLSDRTKVRVEINREAMDEINLALADGLFELGKAIVTEARVPDAPPYGEGLVEKGGVIAYVGRKLVASHGGETSKAAVRRAAEPENYLHAALAAGTAGRRGRRPRQAVQKPREVRLDPRGGITVVAGYGFPGRFVEIGTARQAAQPFLTPSMMEHIPDAGPFVRLAMEKRRIIGGVRRAVGDVYRGTPTAEGKRAVGRARSILRKVGP